MVTVREMLQEAIEGSGSTQAEIASQMGWSPQKFSKKMNTNQMRFEEFMQIADILGLEVTVTRKGDSGPLRYRISGRGRRIRKMVDGVIYDTAKADAVCNTFFADGQHAYSNGKAMELYRVSNGDYVLAEYDEQTALKDRLIPVNMQLAEIIMNSFPNFTSGVDDVTRITVG